MSLDRRSPPDLAQRPPRARAHPRGRAHARGRHRRQRRGVERPARRPARAAPLPRARAAGAGRPPSSRPWASSASGSRRPSSSSTASGTDRSPSSAPTGSTDVSVAGNGSAGARARRGGEREPVLRCSAWRRRSAASSPKRRTSTAVLRSPSSRIACGSSRSAPRPRSSADRSSIDGAARTLLGVMPPRFDLEESDIQVWLPLGALGPTIAPAAAATSST